MITNRINNIILLLFLVLFFNGAGAQDEFSPDSIESIARKVEGYANRGAVDWLHGAYWTGVSALYQMTDDPQILESMRNWGSSHGWKPATGSVEETNADHQCCCQTYCETYLGYGSPDSSHMYGPWRQSWEYTVSVTERGRDLWSWCDALFMSPPAVAMLSHITSNTEYLDTMSVYWQDVSDYLYDTLRHLYYRDITKRNDDDPVFWSRGNGWVLAGLARVLKYMPEDYSHREWFERQFVEMSDKLVEIQPDDTLWHTSLLDPVNYDAEMSGTSFFCYGLAWGVNNGLLDSAEVAPVVRKTWTAMTRNVADDGSIMNVQSEGASPGPVGLNNTTPYAEGAFMLAASEVCYLVTQPVKVRKSRAGRVNMPFNSEIINYRTVFFPQGKGINGAPAGHNAVTIMDLRGRIIENKNVNSGKGTGNFWMKGGSGIYIIGERTKQE